MIGYKSKIKLVFFDRSIIKRNWKKINATPLKRAGLLVRKIARGSIRRTKNRRPSRPGTPPRSRKPGKSPPFKQIFSVSNKLGTSEIVGMVGYGSQEPVPGLHEHGGSASRLVFAGTPVIRRGRRIVKKVRRRVRYPQREFMMPALIKAKNRLPQLWKGSIK